MKSEVPEVLKDCAESLCGMWRGTERPQSDVLRAAQTGVGRLELLRWECKVG